ncbi:hypothetical protein MMC22_010861 [Lobaria immixta]|nr:hypothetical protein [Lobaria immixta]
MSTSLTALSPELVSCIVANLAPEPTSLCNLARCSRQLSFCTIPHLYRHVTIQEGVRARRRTQPGGQLKRFASSMIRSPHLAELVRHLTVQVVRFRKKEAESSDGSESEDDLSPEVVKFEQGFPLSEEEKIKCLEQFSLAHESHHDIILALLLPTLFKVEKLVFYMRMGFDEEDDYDAYYLEQMMQIAALMERPFDIQPPFKALTVFDDSHDMSNIRTASFLGSLLKLPAIQEIFGGFKDTWEGVSGDFGDTDENPIKLVCSDQNLIDLVSSSSPLTKLDLADYELSAATLSHIFRAPKALKTLSYWVCSPAPIKFSDIRHALGPQENCLQSLSLDYFDEHFYKNFDFEPMTSFISFNALKVIKISAVFLAKTDKGTGCHSLIDIFPPNLETLQLTRFLPYIESLLEALEDLLAQKSPRQIPSLQKLVLEEYQFFGSYNGKFAMPSRLMDALWKDTQETVVGKLGRVGSAHGVSIDVIEEPSYEYSTGTGSSYEWPPGAWELSDEEHEPADEEGSETNESDESNEDELNEDELNKDELNKDELNE